MIKPIIHSLMDTDFYIFTMCQLAFHRFKGKRAKYKYKCRNGSGFPETCTTAESRRLFVSLMNKQIDHLCELRFTEDELQALAMQGVFKLDFLDFLRKLKLDRSHIKCYDAQNTLCIEIEGPIEQVIWFETPVLAINSELYARCGKLEAYADDNDKGVSYRLTDNGYAQTVHVARMRLLKKINMIKGADIAGFNITDFGTRRRLSFEWHDELLDILKTEAPHVLQGTSNCYLAMKYDLPMVGTMAHQLLQMYQQLVPAAASQREAFAVWSDEYGDKLQIALSDIFGMDPFLQDFMQFVKSYDGVRHDSGNPYIWAENLIGYYARHSVDSKTKTAVFSDGLTIDKALKLFATFHERINVKLAIGTNLTNDTSTNALQIVIKLVEFDSGPVAKIADTPGKGMCEDSEYEEYIQEIITHKTALLHNWLNTNV